MINTIIGIGDLAVAKAPNALTTLGLGSCVGLVLYDKVSQIGGMVHIMLPVAPVGGELTKRGKYADTGIEELLRRMRFAGANPRMLVAKMAGGAHMFSSATNSDVMKVGQRNVEICHRLIAEKAINIVAEDTGGSVGRTIILDCQTGMLHVRTAYPQTETVI